MRVNRILTGVGLWKRAEWEMERKRDLGVCKKKKTPKVERLEKKTEKRRRVKQKMTNTVSLLHRIFPPAMLRRRLFARQADIPAETRLKWRDCRTCCTSPTPILPSTLHPAPLAPEGAQWADYPGYENDATLLQLQHVSRLQHFARHVALNVDVVCTCSTWTDDMKHYLHQKDFIYILTAFKIHETLFTPERPPIHHKIRETKREREQTEGCGGESRQRETREGGWRYRWKTERGRRENDWGGKSRWLNLFLILFCIFLVATLPQWTIWMVRNWTLARAYLSINNRRCGRKNK